MLTEPGHDVIINIVIKMNYSDCDKLGMWRISGKKEGPRQEKNTEKKAKK